MARKPINRDADDADDILDDENKKEEEEEEEEKPEAEELDFCELCGSSEDDEVELLRCEECGRLHCPSCREYDEEGTPYCVDCYDEMELEGPEKGED